MTKLEHIGIAVRDAGIVQNLLADLLGLRAYKVETVESEAVNTHFVGAGGVKLELLETDVSDSAIGRFLDRSGEGVHHLAFEVADIEAVHGRAIKMGLTPINAEPKPGADGKRIFFLHPKETHGVLIEVCQADRFAGSRERVPMPHGEVAAFHMGAQNTDSVVLLHDAAGSSLTDFGSLIQSLETAHRVVAFDAPGHGESSRWPMRAHFLRAADRHALAVMDHFGIKTAFFVGQGMGAAVAAAAAFRSPDRVSGLALVDPNLLETREDIDAATGSIHDRCGDALPDLASRLMETMPDAIEATTALPSLRTLTCPTLLVSTESPSLSRTLRLQESLGHSTLAVVPASSDDGSVATRIIIDFIAALAR